MPAPTTASLIAPDNRLLGWGLTDLTLYGTQPAPGLTVRPADHAVITDPATPAAHPDAVALTAAESPEARSAQSSAPASETAPTHDVLPTAAAAFHPASPVAVPASSVPPAVGSGTAFQPVIATPLQTVADHGHAADPATPVADVAAPVHPVASIPAPASLASEAGAVVLSLTAPPLSGATTVTDTVNTVAAVATSALAAPAANVAELAHDSVAAAANAVGSIVATATSVAPVPVVDAVAHDAITPVAALTTGLVDSLAQASAAAPLVPPVTAPIEAAGIAAHGLVGAAVATTAAVSDAHGLDGLGGSNPAGGVATLVDMVSTAATFDLHHATAPEAAAAAPSILDTLAADEAPSSLLGDHHDDAGAVSHAVDPHGIHLGL